MNLQLFLRGNLEINTDLAMILAVQWSSKKNMLESMLDDPDATHLKPIKNHLAILIESQKSPVLKVMTNQKVI